MKRKILLLCMLLPALAVAQRVDYGRNVIITKPVKEDLYIAGGTVTINAPVYADLAITGGTVIINDLVQNDILVAGGNVTFSGYAGDDIRCAGGKLLITREVTGDVAVTGGNLKVARSAIINGSLLAAGGEIFMDGVVKGGVQARAGHVQISGSIGRSLDCRAGKIDLTGAVAGPAILAAQEINIGPGAEFDNSVRYWCRNNPAGFTHAVQNGRAVFDNSLQMSTPRWQFLGFASMLGLIWYLLTALVFILLIQYLFGGTMYKAGNTLAGARGRSIGYGFMFLILTPIAIAAAFLSLVGIPVGILMLMLYVFTLLLGTVLASIVLANWYNTSRNKQWSLWKLTWSALGIFILLKLVSLMPLIGWLVILLVICLVFGAILTSIPWRRHAHPGSPALH